MNKINKFMEEEIDTFSDEGKIICPYCDQEMNADDYFEIFGDVGLEWHEEEIECDFCKHKFNINRTFKFLYDTNKIE